MREPWRGARSADADAGRGVPSKSGVVGRGSGLGRRCFASPALCGLGREARSKADRAAIRVRVRRAQRQIRRPLPAAFSRAASRRDTP